MRALLIDPVSRDINQVEYNNQFVEDGTYPGAYSLLHCETIEVVYFDSPWGKVNMFVDEEGLFKYETQQFFIPLHSRGGQPIAGRGLLVGLPDEEGEGTACPITLEEAKEGIVWCDVEE